MAKFTGSNKQQCKEEVNGEPKVLVNVTNKNKKWLAYDLKIREALEIWRHNSGPGHGLNEDYGAYVKTTAWNPVFNQMGDSWGEAGANPLWVSLFWSSLYCTCDLFLSPWLLTLSLPILFPFLTLASSPILTLHWWWFEHWNIWQRNSIILLQKKSTATLIMKATFILCILSVLAMSLNSFDVENETTFYIIFL